MTFDNIQSPDAEKSSKISIDGNTVSSVTIDGTPVSKIDANGNSIFGNPPSTFDFSTGDGRNLQQFTVRNSAIANGTSTDIFLFDNFTESDIAPLGEWVKVGLDTSFKLRNITVSQGDAPFSVYLQHTDDYNSFDTGIVFGGSSYPTNNTGYYLYIDDRNEFGLDADGPFGTELQVNTPTININVWYELVVTTWDSNGNIDAELRDIDGNVISTISVTDTNYTSGNVVIRHGGSSFGGPTLVGEVNL